MADERGGFKNEEEEYAFHLIRAEYHIRHALSLLSKSGLKRSALSKALLNRAQDTLIGLYTQESQNNRKRKKNP